MPALFFLLVIVGGYGAFFYGDDDFKSFCKAGALFVVVLLVIRAIVRWIAEQDRIDRHRTRIERLQAFTNELTKGTLDARAVYSGGTSTVCGVFEGRELQATLRLGRRPWIAVDLRVKEAAAELDAVRPALLERLRAAPLAVTWRRGFTLREAEGPLAHLLRERGLAHVSVGNGWARAEWPLEDEDLRLDVLLDVCRTLARVARVCESRAPGAGIELRPRGEPWTSSSRVKPRS